MKSLVYIGSCKYSGSTLLDLLLGGGENTASLGEVHNLSTFSKSPHKRCTCGELMSECGFWNGVLKELRARQGNPSLEFADTYLNVRRDHKWPDRLVPHPLDLFLLLGSRRILQAGAHFSVDTRNFRDAAKKAFEVFEAASTVARADYIIDSSKEPTLLKSLYLHAPQRTKIIYLVRDGRAVAHSIVKNEARDGGSLPAATKGEDRFLAGARWWVNKNRNLQRVIKSIPKRRVFFLRYEDLCTNTEEILSRLSEFIGTDLSMRGETIDKQCHHNIAGNPMRWNRDDNKIELREEWKTLISQEDLATFEAVGGKLNRRLGYGDA